MGAHKFSTVGNVEVNSQGQRVGGFQGYKNKQDITNIAPGTLVKGSQNVVLNEGERVAVRKGYTIDGDAATGPNYPIQSAYDWVTHRNVERNLRSTNTELQYRYVDTLDVVTWRTLATGFTSVAFNFAEFWDVTEQQDVLLFVNGTSNVYMWSGGITTFASATAATLTKQGTTTWAQEGFLTAGTRQVIIDGITYTYTGGEATLTLTGVTPDPTLGGHTVGDVIHQAIVTTANGGLTNGPAVGFNQDLIAVHYNYVYLGATTNRQIYVSQQNSYLVYTFSSPRTPGQGAILTMDATPFALISMEDEANDDGSNNGLYVSAGQNQWYRTILELSADQARESLYVRKLKVASLQGAQSQAFVTKLKNNVAFVSFEPTFDFLGRVENINTAQSTNISDPIKNDFDAYDFSGGSAFYHRYEVYISVPAEGKWLIYNLDRQFWAPPMIGSFSRFSVISGELYAHSSTVAETYKLFQGYSDNGNPIDARAAFSYVQFGERYNKKSFTEYYTEGYISSNTELFLTMNYDWNGCDGIQSYSILGSDSAVTCDATGDGSLGKQSLGKRSLAGRGSTVDETLPPKLRWIQTLPAIDFWELQTIYSSNDVDQRWELLCHGAGVQMSTADNNEIKK